MKPTEIFDLVYNFNHKKLHDFAFNLLHDNHKAFDIIQECFKRFSNQDDFINVDHATRWVFTVCRNLSFKDLAKNKRYVFQGDDNHKEDISPIDSPFEELSSGENREEKLKIIRNGLNKLSRKFREALIMRHFHGEQLSVIGKKLKIKSDGATSNLLCRAYGRLMSEINKESIMNYVFVKKDHRVRDTKSKNYMSSEEYYHMMIQENGLQYDPLCPFKKPSEEVSAFKIVERGAAMVFALKNPDFVEKPE